MHCYSSFSCRTPTLNHLTVPGIDRSSLASPSSLLPSLQWLFSQHFQLFRLLCLPSNKSRKILTQRQLNSSPLQPFRCWVLLGTTQSWRLVQMGSGPRGVLQGGPLSPSSFPHCDCGKHLSPQTSHTTCFSPNLLSAHHSQFCSPLIVLLPT